MLNKTAGKRGREPGDYSTLLPYEEASKVEDPQDFDDTQEDVDREGRLHSLSGLQPTAADRCSSILSLDSYWTGKINIGGSVRVEGHLSGEVKAEHTVHISKGAKVDANIEAAFVVIAGDFTGLVSCQERLELMPTGKFNGAVTTKMLTVHEGAFIDGEIHMTDSQSGAKKGTQVKRASANTSNHTDAIPAETSDSFASA